MNRRRFFIGLCALAALSTAVRVAPGGGGLPYLRYVDEGHVLHVSAHLIADATIDPGWYRYPPLTAEATAAVAVFASPVTGTAALRSGARATEASEYYDTVLPTSLIVSGRIVVLAFSVGTVVVIGLLGARLAGERAGLVAAGLAAVLPAFVSRSFIVLPDVAATFFFVVGAWCASMIRASPHRARWALAAGAAAGLAASAKYLPGVVGLAPVALIVASRGTSIARRIGLLVLTGAAAIAALFVTFPAVFFKTQVVRDELREQLDIYADKTTRAAYLPDLVSRDEVGWLVVILAVGGLVVLLARRRSRSATLAVLVPMGVLVASYARYDTQPFRNLLPLLPLVCVAAATALVEFARIAAPSLAAFAARIRHRTRGTDRTLVTDRDRLDRARATAAANGVLATAVIAIVALSGTVPVLRGQVGIVDTRVRARRWVQAHVEAECTVVIPADVAFLPPELEKIDAQVILAEDSRTLTPGLRRDGDFVIAGREKGRFPDWISELGDIDAVAEFGSAARPDEPGSWRGNDQKLWIYQLHACPG